MPMYDNERYIHVSPTWENIIIEGYNPDNVTPQGYDFTLHKLERMIGRGQVLRDSKILPAYSEILPQYANYRLQPGMYLLEFAEIVSIPSGYMGLMWPRSSLLRCGVDLSTAVWDQGYTGRSKTTMVVHNPGGFTIEKGTPCGHMVLVPVTTSSGLYSGQYQGEGVSNG